MKSLKSLVALDFGWDSQYLKRYQTRNKKNSFSQII